MDPIALLVASLVVAVAAFVQASVGFGYALVAAPILTLIDDRLVPGPVILSSLALSAAAALREHGSIDRRGLWLGLAGRLPGTATGAIALAWLPPAAMEVTFGGLVLVAVLLSITRLHVALTRATLLATGFVSGVMGTMTSIGGPPMALLYQHQSGPSLRATLNAFFAFGSVLSLPALYWAGHFGRWHLLAGSLLLPGTALGYAASGISHAFLDRGRTRAAVLAVSGISAIAVVVKALR